MGLNLLKLNTKAVCTTGDLHGRFNDIIYFLKTNDIENTVLIICGDIGMGFHQKEYYKQIFSKIEKELKKRNCYLLLIRGNHDDGDVFVENSEYNTKHILLIPDYTVIQFYDINDIKHKGETFNVLAIGGAVSIDRCIRIKQNTKDVFFYSRFHRCTLEEAENKAPKCYWLNEMPIYDEDKLKELKDKNIKIDAIVSHTCPHFCNPITKDGIKNWLLQDIELEKDIDNERDIMSKIYYQIKKDEHPLKMWVYGHYHYHNMDLIDNIKFILHDMVRDGKFDIAYIKDFDKN